MSEREALLNLVRECMADGDDFDKIAKSLGFETGWKLWSKIISERTEEERLEAERAQVMLETYGSQSGTDEPFAGHWWCTRSYAPEWLSFDDLNETNEPGRPDVTRDDCITVLTYSDAEHDPPVGWREAYRYQAGEKTCPWCEGSGEQQDWEGNKIGEICKLCNGDKYLYDGDECQVVVFAPLKRPEHWIYGSGQPGCLYDSSGVVDSKEAAIESLCFTFDCLGKGSLARMRRDLEEHGSHYFDRRIRPFAGASYCEIDSCDCEGHDHPEGDDCD